MDSLTKRCWAEINLDSIAHNYHTLRSMLPGSCSLLGVVKANAYGHGAVPVAKLLESLGCPYLAVASFDEAVSLRHAGLTAPILVLGWTDPKYACKLSELDITQTIGDSESAEQYIRELTAAGCSLKIHIKLDTGMGRTGFDVRDSALAWEHIVCAPCFDAEGIFTHFAQSDEPDSDFTDRQFKLFISAVERIESRCKHQFAIKHCANSAAVINYPQYALDMVRPGLALYGIDPMGGSGTAPLRPAMTLKSRVAMVNKHIQGDTVSYGRTYTVEGDRDIAVVSLGYADGLHRALSGKFHAYINGCRVPQVGRICMDMCMFDVTDVPCKAGDEVIIFGPDGSAVSELADNCGTIPYELMCAVSDRVPRLYV